MFFQKLIKVLIVVCSLAFLLVAGVFSYGYLKRVPEIYGIFHPVDPKGELTDELQHTNRKKPNDNYPLAVETSKTGADSMMVLERFYNSCGHVLIEEHPMESRYTGKTQEELAAIFPEWKVKRFSAEKVVFLIEIDSYCPDHYIIKQEEGLLVIFRPDKDTGLLLVAEATNIPYDQLSPEMQERLAEGIVVDSIEGVEQLIEDWGS
ncbi:MAG: hypothetical protein ACOYEH_05185 [Caldicoprobacterales bacterium]|nr:hypothetical protein [Clostridiales bacterium]